SSASVRLRGGFGGLGRVERVGLIPRSYRAATVRSATSLSPRRAGRASADAPPIETRRFSRPEPETPRQAKAASRAPPVQDLCAAVRRPRAVPSTYTFAPLRRALLSHACD